MMNEIDLSIVIPAYNEVPHLKENFQKILWVLDKLKINYEVIFVEDCSKDETARVIKNILLECKKDYIRAFFHEVNRGRGAAVAEGISHARGEVVGFLDIDLEVSELYIPAFYWKIKEGAEMAIATRNYDFTLSKIFRYIASRGYSFIVRQLLLSPFKDTEAGYKFFNRKKILPILKKTVDAKWFWDTEIVIRSLDAGLKIIEIPVVFVRNPKKKSTVKIIPDSIEYLRSIIKFRRHRFSS